MTDLIIEFGYQNIVKHFRNLRKTKDFLANVNSGHFEAGWIDCNFRYSPLDECVEQVGFTLKGEGPFYSLDNRTLRYGCPDFKTPKRGGIFWLGHLRFRVIDINLYGELFVMFPDALSVLIYAILPFSRWVDLIYRRLILTASAWNLAKFRVGGMPHWGHFKWSKEYKKAKEKT